MNNVGIWIDKKNAKIVSVKAGKEHLDTIVSELEDFNIGGGSGTRLKGGPQDVVQDSKYLEREKHQLSNFFKEIATTAENADALVIFGPAQTGQKLHKELLEKHSNIFNKKKISVEKADNMTDNQIIAWVKNHFNSNK